MAERSGSRRLGRSARRWLRGGRFAAAPRPAARRSSDAESDLVGRRFASRSERGRRWRVRCRRSVASRDSDRRHRHRLDRLGLVGQLLVLRRRRIGRRSVGVAFVATMLPSARTTKVGTRRGPISSSRRPQGCRGRLRSSPRVVRRIGQPAVLAARRPTSAVFASALRRRKHDARDLPRLLGVLDDLLVGSGAVPATRL